MAQRDKKMAIKSDQIFHGQMETSGNQRMAKSCRLFFGIFLTKKQRRHFQTGFYLIFEIEFRMEIISFWNMWPACHADCSIHSTPSSGLKHHVGNVRRSPDLNFQCQINSPQKMCRVRSFRLPVFISITQHIQQQPADWCRGTFCEPSLPLQSNVKRSYKVRSRATPFIFQQPAASQPARKNWRLN